MATINLSTFGTELEAELASILKYWQTNTIDKVNGGFVGQIDHRNQVNPTAPKGVILNTRILWTFSRANNFYKDARYTEECERAYTYLTDYFWDKENGGFFWEVDYEGKPTNRKKQIYAQAFGIYALSEYYKFSKNAAAKQLAIDLFELLEQKAFDPIFGGYCEALGEEWQAIEDVRLSYKEINAPKTSNTHLHILEAYTTLLEVTGDERVRASLAQLLVLFRTRIINEAHRLQLFFSEDWSVMSSEVSFGHDIETVWLLIHAVRVIGNPALVATFEQIGEKMTNAFLAHALDAEHAVINGVDLASGDVDRDRYWWPQIEAMVGLIYLWRIQDSPLYLMPALQIWEFTKRSIIDRAHGEWFFRVDSSGKPYLEEDKVGPWKCPYHNARGIIEILEIINTSYEERESNKIYLSEH